MGTRFTHYEKYLRRLEGELKLKDTVRWHGHVKAKQLSEWLGGTSHVFVSPTLQATESVSAGLVRSLASGQTAVLSAWGGHIDLAQYYPKVVELVPVHGYKHGPFVSPVELANAIQRALIRHGAARRRKDLRSPWALPMASAILGRLIDEWPWHNVSPLYSSMIFRMVNEQVDHLSRRWLKLTASHRPHPSDSQPPRFFRDYSDPLAAIFFWAYGMRGEPGLELGSAKEYWIPPWVRITDGVVVGHDPHRGRVFFDLKPAKQTLVRDIFGAKFRLEKSDVQALVHAGFAFPGRFGPTARLDRGKGAPAYSSITSGKK